MIFFLRKLVTQMRPTNVLLHNFHPQLKAMKNQDVHLLLFSNVKTALDSDVSDNKDSKRG